MTSKWIAVAVALAFAAGGVTGWLAKPDPAPPAAAQPAGVMPNERMVPLRVGDRVRIDAPGPLAGASGTVVALDCGDSNDLRMVEVNGAGHRVRDADLTLLPPAPP